MGLDQVQLKSMSETELLQVYVNLLSELKEREIARSFNAVTGDYAEWLVAQKLNLALATTGKSGFDATDSEGKKYQIKGRRGKSTTLGIMREIEKAKFDFLIAVFFDDDFSVRMAYLIPYKVVWEEARTKMNEYQNGVVLNINTTWVKKMGKNISDITSRLKSIDHATAIMR